MAIDKIQAESINLGDTFAFTGTVTGAGGFIKLLASTSSSGVANFDIDSTYINSTYDNYRIIAGYQYVNDNVGLNIRFHVGGSQSTANNSYENAALTSSTYNYDRCNYNADRSGEW